MPLFFCVHLNLSTLRNLRLLLCAESSSSKVVSLAPGVARRDRTPRAEPNTQNLEEFFDQCLSGVAGVTRRTKRIPS